MFCPNCASKNDSSQHFCRTCGLKLDAIIANVATQRPSQEFAKLLKRKKLFERLGLLSLSIAGLIGIMLVLANAFYYKLQFFGPELLFRAASIAIVAFAVAAIFFLKYPRLFMKLDQLNPHVLAETKSVDEPVNTNRLLPDPPFEPASVTEHSTELLKIPR